MPVNAVKWNRNPEFNKQFITADDSSRLSLYDLSNPRNNGTELVSNGLLTCLHIDSTGRKVITGGIDTKLHLF